MPHKSPAGLEPPKVKITDSNSSTESLHKNKHGTKHIPKHAKLKEVSSPNDTKDLPPPYWEEKLAKNNQLLEELKKIRGMEAFLQNNAAVAENFMKHPNIANEVAKDKSLADKIMKRPELLKEMIAYKAKEAHHDDKLIPHIKNDERQTKEPGHKLLQVISNLTTLKAPNSNNSSSTLESKSSSFFTYASRATFPFDAKIGPNSPKALKYLTDSSRLFMTHHVEIMDGYSAFCDRSRNYFDILDAYGRLIYRAYESPRGCLNFGIFKQVNMQVKEPDHLNLIAASRRCGSLRYIRKMIIHCPPESYIGCVEQKWNVFKPSTFLVKNKEGETVIVIRVIKSFYRKSRRHDTEFELRTNSDQAVIGKITGEWLDLHPGAFSSDIVYGMTFPKKLNCNIKVCLLTAWFLIYKLYFEGGIKKEIRHDLTKQEMAYVRYIEDLHPRKSRKTIASPTPSTTSGSKQSLVKPLAPPLQKKTHFNN